MQIKMIAAIGIRSELGTADNQIPWAFHKEDMKIFSQKTKSEGGIVVMGRKTYESLPERFRPLKDRRNIVITRDKNWESIGVETFSSVGVVIENFKDSATLWICGGGEIYKQFIDKANELHISHFDISPEGASVYFPEIDLKVWREVESSEFIASEKSPKFTHKIYIRKI
jgi:dihydrofolate reductase